LHGRTVAARAIDAVVLVDCFGRDAEEHVERPATVLLVEGLVVGAVASVQWNDVTVTPTQCGRLPPKSW
jgi:uncharacterized YccA/Bax inhibitor family protein